MIFIVWPCFFNFTFFVLLFLKLKHSSALRLWMCYKRLIIWYWFLHYTLVYSLRSVLSLFCLVFLIANYVLYAWSFILPAFYPGLFLGLTLFLFALFPYVKVESTWHYWCIYFCISYVNFLMRMQGLLSSTFPIQNRNAPVTVKALKNHVDRTKSLRFVKRISDFHMLLWIARFLDVNTDVPALAACVQMQTTVPDGYQLLIESLATASWCC